MTARERIRHAIARRAARELRDGAVTNLGIGIPTLVVDYIPDGVDVVLQSENGIVGVGPVPDPDRADPDCRNAGNAPVGVLPGGSFVDSLTSFGLIRGGHVDVTMLGTLQVDGEGNIANYETHGRKIGMGGAMDLVAGARTVYVLTEHCDREGRPKLVRRCSLPLTGASECDAIITERAVFRRRPAGGFVLTEVARGYTLDEIATSTLMPYAIAETVELDAWGAP